MKLKSDIIAIVARSGKAKKAGNKGIKKHK